MKNLWLGLSALAFSFGGCASGLETDLTGSWYGEGPDGNNEMCFVFCGDGRMFAGDNPCSDMGASDFEAYYTVSFTDDAISYRVGSDRTVTLQIAVDGDTMTYSSEERAYTVSRVADVSFCSDQSRTRRTFE